MVFQPETCSLFHIPVSYGVHIASGETAVHSVRISPAPPTARLPRCTKCHCPGMPSAALYCCIGESTIRFLIVRSRNRSGLKSVFIFYLLLYSTKLANTTKSKNEVA